MRNELHRVYVELTGKAIQDHPTKVELAQDFAANRGWTHPGSNGKKTQNAIFDPTGVHFIADNYEMLAWLMDRHNGFIRMGSGAWQIDPVFHALSDEEVLDKFN